MTKKQIHNRREGFTLIELLVVISIIALLSSVVLASLQSARSKARDQSTISGALQLRNAVEIYKTKNGYYPHKAPGVSSANMYIYQTNPPSPPAYIPYGASGFNLASILVPGYIASIPSPSANGQLFAYMSSGDTGSIDFVFNCTGNISDIPKYVIMFTLENPTNKFNLLSEFVPSVGLVPTPGEYCITVQ